MHPHTAHKANAPGDFYVKEGCCLTCAVPHTVAPDLFAWSDGRHTQCVVCKQPSTPEEFDRMVEAFQVSDLDCIRYKGSDRVIRLRLDQVGAGNQCDVLPHSQQEPAKSQQTAWPTEPWRQRNAGSPVWSLLLRIKALLRRRL
jgi:hypothetical protein